MGKELFTALLFYLPFLLVIAFTCLSLLLGIACILSGTLLILLFAAYGIYTALRDVGLFKYGVQKAGCLWKYIHEDIVANLQQSFLLKDTEKLPKRNVLFLCHPHGLLGYSWVLHFCYGIHEWLRTNGRPFLAIHSILFKIPFVRDVFEQFHCIEAKEDIIKEYLQKGHSVAILTGGVEEMLYNGETPIKLILKKRKGYARIAKDSNVPIVPLFTVGENELFPNETWWVWKGISGLIYKWTKIPIPLPSWASMKAWASILQKPLDKPVQTFVLDSIETKEKDTSEIQTHVIKTIETFLRNKQISAKIIA